MPAQPNTSTDPDADHGDAADDATADSRSDAADDAVESDVSETVQSSVPADADPRRCPYCSRPFTTQERVDLHVGLEHYDVCSDAEATAFEDAYTDETEEIRLFRLKTTAVIVVLYFGLLIVYSLAT